jgi:ribosomal protein S7
MVYNHYIKINYYNNIFKVLQQKFIGHLIKKGKKIVALNNWFELKYLLKKKTKREPNLLILISILNSLVKVTFIKKRFGSTKKEIPIFLKFERQIKFAIRSYLSLSTTSKGIFINKLVNLICNSYKKKGPIMKKNYIIYKKAIDNKVLLSFIRK